MSAIKQNQSILLIAGEASGDEHASLIVRELKNKYPDFQIWGMGGDKLQEAGMQVLLDIKTYASVMGFTEVIKKIKIISEGYQTLLRLAKKQKPDLVILVDYPGFNLRIAKDLKKIGCKILYFISPQIWAWKKGRAKIIRKNIDQVAVIFPFEEKYLRDLGIKADFVGHPFSDRHELVVDRNEFLRSLDLNPQYQTLAILPGSRKDEIKKLLVPMCQAFLRLQAQKPELQAIIPIASTIDKNFVEQILKNASLTINSKQIAFVNNQEIRRVFKVVDAGLLKSGTITMEGVLAELPFIVVYKVHPLTYYLGQKIVTGIKNFAMPNIIAGREVVRELLQEQVNPECIAQELQDLLDNVSRRKQIINDLRQIKEQLKGAGSFSTMAKRTVGLIEKLLVKPV
ncbi:MAG: lipid-A-disaccharide synthase [Deltaproteobacteria bacterium]|jgi:lipid-A-disaccharide synthase|nr:lipid-A-disaccharide synthase [Deltaproteobacteria bacterium]